MGPPTPKARRDPLPRPASAHQLQQHERTEAGAHEAQVRTQRRYRGAGALRWAAGPRAHFRRELGHRSSARLPGSHRPPSPPLPRWAPALTPLLLGGLRLPPPLGSGRYARCLGKEPGGARCSRNSGPALVAGPAPLTLRSPPRVQAQGTCSRVHFTDGETEATVSEMAPSERI